MVYKKFDSDFDVAKKIILKRYLYDIYDFTQYFSINKNDSGFLNDGDIIDKSTLFILFVERDSLLISEMYELSLLI